ALGDAADGDLVSCVGGVGEDGEDALAASGGVGGGEAVPAGLADGVAAAFVLVVGGDVADRLVAVVLLGSARVVEVRVGRLCW
ncbi:MAG: hypothetical protein M3513_03155, partial [Actinomycetota bacterium]|nr:hypothetical protein [Actinomycetota bacterium]